jgi:myo-inositol-1(or 4)-monophosphatase
MHEINSILELAKSAALAAGKIAKEIRFGSDLQLQSKKDRSQVTAGDFASEKIIKQMIEEAFQNHKILSEESATSWQEKDYWAPNLWIIDPIDGTTNYVYGIPLSAVSIAYAENGSVLCGVVYNLFTGELFHALKNSGAFLNDCPIRPNDCEKLEDALVSTGLPYDRPINQSLRNRLINVANNCRDLRRLAAASLDLCFVACGRLDAYFETVESWDMAAGALIASEAGCRVTHLSPAHEGRPNELNGHDLLVSCPKIAAGLVQLLSQT